MSERRKAIDEAIEAIKACAPKDPNDVWESAYRHIAEVHIEAISHLRGGRSGLEQLCDLYAHSAMDPEEFVERAFALLETA